MNLISAENLSKRYSEKVLLGDVSLGISDTDKVGLIGVNGTGKSTFLKVLAGLEAPDSGRVLRANAARVVYLPQSPEFEPGTTVLQQVFRGETPLMQLLRDYEAIMEAMHGAPEDARLQNRMHSVMQRMDAMDAWGAESTAKGILTRLGILDFSADVATLSGGQRKRVAIAGALIEDADLLILDEPTNHIDSDTVAWLEGMLARRRGALLMVTHDRYFLDRVVNRIIELDQGSVYSYEANYSRFLELKAEREEMAQATESKRQNLLRRELEWIRRGAQARSTKQKARIARFEELSGRQGPESAGNVEIQALSSRLGRTIIEAEGLSKTLGGRRLFSDFSYILLRDDRIGIVGPNGSGKSTLLRMLTGRLEPDEGSVRIGSTVNIGFFTQENEELNEELRVIESVREIADIIETTEGKVTASQMLERFLFPPAVQWTPVYKLSGGEKRRLHLLRMLMKAPNILVLDEPTNDLDTATLGILEAYIDTFPGAVVTVSHDRFFLDRTAERLFAFEDGNIRQYEGDYSDYLEAVNAAREKEIQAAAPKEAVRQTRTTASRGIKMTFREQKEFETIDEEVAAAEALVAGLEVQIAAAGADFTRLQTLLEEKESAESALTEKMERWVYLNELAEQIAAEKAKK